MRCREVPVKVWRRTLTLLVPLFLCIAVLAHPIWAQAPTGAFLCSAGAHDGQPCNSNSDCPDGACVKSQGVCDGGVDDALPCDCPSGTCSESATCFEPSATQGMCSGGTSAGKSCSCSCAGGRACVGTQQVCVGGLNKGFSCLRDSQCPNSQCRSTGLICASGTDFAGFSCSSDTDCCSPPGVCGTGSCVAPVSRPTATSTPSPLTPRPTDTPVPVGSRTVTGTLGPGKSLLAQDAPTGSTRLVLVDASSFPLNGAQVQIGNDPIVIPYTRDTRVSLANTLYLSYALPKGFPAGTVVAVAPTDGGSVHTETGQGAGCSVDATRHHAPVFAVGGALLLWTLRGLRGNSERARARRRCGH